MEFKVGDKVTITKEHQGMNLIGATAKIVNTDGKKARWYGLDIAGWSRGHCCDVLGDDACSGWWVPSECFEKANTFKGNK